MIDRTYLNPGLLVLVAINILNFYDRQVVGALTEPMRKEFGLSDTQVGFLGSAFIWLYAIVGLPLGHLADRWKRKYLLVGGVTVWSGMTAFAALATSYGMVLISRLGVAVGEAVAAPCGTSWIGDLFPPAKRARALSFFMLGVPVGQALSFFLSGPIAQAWGWRMAMIAAAGPALLLVPLLLTMKEPQRGASEAVGSSEGSMLSVLRIPTMWWIIASGALLNFIYYAMATFVPAFLSRVHHLTLAESGLATGAAVLIGGGAGGLFGGRLGDMAHSHRPDGRMLYASWTSLFIAPASFLAVQQPVGSTALVLLFLACTYAGLNAYYGCVYSSIQDIIPPGLRATAMALYFMAMYLLGASFGPILTGQISDFMARRAADAAGSAAITDQFRAVGLQNAMYIIPVLAVVLWLVLWAGSRTIVKDMITSPPKASLAPSL